jgi:hypothetical protein
MATEVNAAEVHSLDLFDDPQLTVLDRSTLEAYSQCPFQAYSIETGKVKITNRLMAAGEELHQAISRTIQWWIDCDGMPEEFAGRVRGAITEYLEGELRSSRPDVQPQVIAGMRASLWAFGDFLSGIRPVNILHFDGGEGDLSGQLAVDLGGLGVRATSELDLVVATESVEVIRVYDWKSGHKEWTASEVAQAFQFQMHGDLLFERYPDVLAVDYRVWNTRSNRVTHKVLLDRKQQPAFRARVRMAAEAKMRYGDNPPAWPAVEKCETCPAAVLCPEATETTKNHTSDPVAVLEQLIASEARVKALKGFLTKTVDETGSPVVSGSHAFGRVKKSERKPTAQIYKLSTVEGDES